MNLFISNFKYFFLTVLTIFIFGLTSFCLISEYLVASNKKKSSYEKIKKKYHNPFQKDYVLFADSHGFSGIKERDNLINHSFVGDNLLTIVRKISFFVERNKVKGIIIQADPHQLAMYRLTKNQDELIDDFLNGNNNLLTFYRMPYRQNLINYWNEFIKGFFNSNEQKKELKKDINIKRKTLIRVNTHTPINNFEISKHVQELKKLLLNLKKKNINICLISFPLASSYRKHIKNNENFIDAYKFYNELSKKFSIKYFDYKSLLTDNYFSDPDHLNIKGSNELTKVVLNDCFKENNL